MKKVAIVQSNYIPWKGYFDLINSVDLFLFHDDLQYTKADWRNRNKIKTPEGSKWLTIPAGTNEKRLICEVEIGDPSWKQKHRKTILQYYKDAPYFNEYGQLLDVLYENDLTNLSDYNQMSVKYIADSLGIRTEFGDTRLYKASGRKTEKLIHLLTQVGASRYLTGPSGKNYLVEKMFAEAGIELEYMDYSGYPEYPQLYPPFEHAVSIVDLLFNTGPRAKEFLKSWS